MIRRASRKQHFTVLANSTIEDDRLSFGARGLLAYVLSKPDDWKFSYRSLSKAGPDGETKTRGFLNELRSAGYLSTMKKQDAKGRWITESVLDEVPPSGGFRGPEEPAPVDRGLLPNTDNQILIPKEPGNDLEIVSNAPVKARKQDLVFEAVAVVCGINWHELTPAGRGPLGRAVKELKSVGATPEEIVRRADRWPQLFEGATLTPSALAKHWAALGRVRPKQTARRETNVRHNFRQIWPDISEEQLDQLLIGEAQ